MRTLDYLKITFGTIIFICFVDLLGFVAWFYSNQTPVDNFYIGSITANILKNILL